MSFNLGPKSLQELVGVHPRLVAVVQKAIQISIVDFNVHDGLRTQAEQVSFVAQGVSKTMHSLHLPQADGYSHAVDLVPWLEGQLRWEWGPIYQIASAMHKASAGLNTRLIWGGVWDKELNDLSNVPEGLEVAVKQYCKRHPGPDFLDGPHFQLV